jgi:hypothetical protein
MPIAVSDWQAIWTAPKDGRLVLCWHPKWNRPELLVWKINPWHQDGMADAYFGDPEFQDDIYYATLGNEPKYFLPFELPKE